MEYLPPFIGFTSSYIRSHIPFLPLAIVSYSPRNFNPNIWLFPEIVYLCTRRIEDRAPAFMNLGLRRSFIKRRSNARGASHVAKLEKGMIWMKS